MKPRFRERGFTLLELMVTTGLVGVVGAIVYTLLNIGLILGAKNTAVNTAHQQARTAMQQIIQDIHTAVSLPYLVNVDGSPQASPAPGTSPLPASGIAFQQYAIGPLRVAADASATDKKILISIPVTNPPTPIPVGSNAQGIRTQRLIVPTHEIELDIATVTARPGNIYEITFGKDASNNDIRVGVDIDGTGSPKFYNIVCFVTNKVSYIVDPAGNLVYTGPRTVKATMGTGINNLTPFSTPTTAAGAYDYKFIAAIDLSTTDSKYDKRGFKSANILLNGRVPTRARLTTKTQ